MTCSRTLQGRFVLGRYTSLILLLLSVTVWTVGIFTTISPAHVGWPGYTFVVPGKFFSVALPLASHVAIAAMLGTFNVHERRINWFASLYIFLASVSVFINHDITASFSSLLFVLVMWQLFNCHQGATASGSVFTSFALLGLSSFILPQFIILIPMLVVYILMMNIRGTKCMAAGILGLMLPFWFLFGITYVWPEASGIMPSVDEMVGMVDFPSLVRLTPLSALVLVMELGIMIPAILLFVRSSVPSKPHLRRKLLFLMIVNAYLLVLSFFSNPDYWLMYAWRLPGLAVMASYIFSFRVTRLSNIYFILVFIIWFVIAVLGIWANR